MQRWQCPINNSTLKSFVWSELDSHFFVSWNCLFLFAVSIQKWLAHFLYTRINGEISRFKHVSGQEKNIFHIFIRSRSQGYRCKLCIVMFAWGSLQISRTVPLSYFFKMETPEPASENLVEVNLIAVWTSGWTTFLTVGV